MRSRYWIQFAGLSGIVLLGFGVFGYLLLGGTASTLLNIHLLGGVLLLIVFLLFGGVGQCYQADALDQQSLFRFWINTGFTVALLLFCLVCLNWLALRHDRSVDLTEARLHSLSLQSIELARTLDKKVHITAFAGMHKKSALELRRLITQYQKQNPEHISYEVIDPVSRPDRIEKLRMKPGEMIAITFGAGGQQRTLRIKQANEVEISNALMRLQRGDQRTIYYITGHGEPDLDESGHFGTSRFMAALRSEHGKVMPLQLVGAESVPEDAASVLVISPRSKISADEKRLLTRYVDNGGSLFVAVDPGRQNNLSGLIEHFGISASDNVVIDKASRPVGEPQLGAQPIVRRFGEHPILQAFGANAVAVFNVACTVKPHSDPAPPGAKYTQILFTAPTAWGESSVEALLGNSQAHASLDKSDEPGPVTLGVVLEQSVSPEGDKDLRREGRVVVVGDSDWFLNANIGWYSNRDLALNFVGWLAGVEGGVTIRPRAHRASAVDISRDHFIILLVASFIFPELLLLLGLFTWLRRRHASGSSALSTVSA